MSFKDRLAFFQNAVSQQNNNPPSNSRHSGLKATSKVEQINKKQNNSVATNQNPAHQMNEVSKLKKETSNEELPNQTKKSENGFAAKMAFFKNQVDNQTTQKMPPPSKTSHKHHQKSPIIEEKIKDVQKTKQDETKREVSKPIQPKDGKFAEKMAFFNNQVNNQSSQEKTHHEKHNKKESSHQRANIADRVALYNNLVVPLGKPAERRNKPNKINNNPSDIFSEKEPTTISEMLSIENDNNDVIKVKNDLNDESNPLGIGIVRQNRCRNSRRRPGHIPEL